MLLDNIIHEDFLSQPLQTVIKQFKIAVTLLTGDNGTSNVTCKKRKLISMSVFGGVEYIVITIPPGAYQLESLSTKNKRIMNDEGYTTEEDY